MIKEDNIDELKNKIKNLEICINSLEAEQIIKIKDLET